MTINRPVSQIVYDASGKKHIVRNGALRLNKFSGDETRYIGDYIMINDTIDRLQTPYGYLRNGVFHSYLFDYQGNIVCVMAGNKVVQTNFYYADGLPMNNCTGVTANAFKYTAKELSLFRGLPVYDYTARHTLPAAGNPFRTMDRECESFFHLSPYSFCGGDPINFTDPTGNMMLAYDGERRWQFMKIDGEYGFYNSDGERFSGEGFIKNLENDLITLLSKPIGETLVTGVIDSDQIVTIYEAETSDENGFIQGKGVNHKINWCSKNTVQENNQNKSLPSFVTLGHEVAHAYDQMELGGLDSDIWTICDGQQYYKAEIFAGNMENFIRTEHGIAPRVTYLKDLNTNPATIYAPPSSFRIKPSKQNLHLWKSLSLPQY